MYKFLNIFILTMVFCLSNCFCNAQDIFDELPKMQKAFTPFYKNLPTCTPIKTSYTISFGERVPEIYEIIGREGNYGRTKEGNQGDLWSCSYPMDFAKELSREFLSTGNPKYETRNRYCFK